MRDTTKKYTVLQDGRIQFANGQRANPSNYRVTRKKHDEYVKERYRTFNVKIDKSKHPDVIKHLESQDVLTQYILALIEADMQRQSAH